MIQIEINRTATITFLGHSYWFSVVSSSIAFVDVKPNGTVCVERAGKEIGGEHCVVE